MKRSLILTIMLVAALQISAQSNTRSRAISETEKPARESESTQSSRQAERPEKKAITRESNPAQRPTSRKQESNPSTRPSAQSREIAKPAGQTRERRVSTTPSQNTPSNREYTRPESRPSQKGSNTDRSQNQGTGRNVGNSKTPARSAVNPSERRESRDSYNNTNAPGTSTQTNKTGRERVAGSDKTNNTVNRSAQSTRGSEYTPRTDVKYVQARRAYETPARKTVVRTTYHNTGYTYRPIEYRRLHNPYRAPARVEIYWSVPMYHQYRAIYPDFNYWYYPAGYRIQTVSAYDAAFYVGELARVYGRVENVWYSRATNEYYLYFGGPYPYQDFSIIIPANVARRFNRRPERFFTNRYVAVTGLVSRWEGKPEMLIKKSNQLDIY